MEKNAADLKPYDVVAMPGEERARVVERIEFHDRPIDSNGTTGVWIHWTSHPRPNLVAADKKLRVVTGIRPEPT